MHVCVSPSPSLWIYTHFFLTPSSTKKLAPQSEQPPIRGQGLLLYGFLVSDLKLGQTGFEGVELEVLRDMRCNTVQNFKQKAVWFAGIKFGFFI